MSFNLFVYGTLRAGGPADDILTGCEQLGRATVGGTLYDIDGRFPALVLYGNAPVQGEIWRCPAELLARLDAYEDTGSGLFRRIATHVTFDGGTLPCWLYTAGPALSRLLTPERRMADGDWSAR
ncbi:MAG TPA: gamma-glutamylcyclotransferase family protein [Longimicrobiales bacterium]|nr:gamma-glutamylcyclotransferase family protein [Longimicrobiales bacterium]